MKTYWIKDNVSSASFVRGKGYTVEELKQITGVFNEKILIEQILLVFDEYDTINGIGMIDTLDIDLGTLKKYGNTTLHAVRTTINPSYPTFVFELHVCSTDTEKLYSEKWLSKLPLWLWTQIEDPTNGIVRKSEVCDDISKLSIKVKDGQRVWDIMEKMHGLECTLK